MKRWVSQEKIPVGNTPLRHEQCRIEVDVLVIDIRVDGKQPQHAGHTDEQHERKPPGHRERPQPGSESRHSPLALARRKRCLRVPSALVYSSYRDGSSVRITEDSMARS